MFPVWPCSVWGLPDDPLPNRRCALTAPFHPYLRPCGPSAVYFLLHFPSLTGPRVTRHTTLWSSDFPLWAKAQSDHPSACEGTGYLQVALSHWRFTKRNRGQTGHSPFFWRSGDRLRILQFEFGVCPQISACLTRFLPGSHKDDKHYRPMK